MYDACISFFKDLVKEPRLPSIFKRTKNLLRANITGNEMVAPSIRSVVEMREHLAQKHAALMTDYNRTQAKVTDYQALISRWNTRMGKAQTVMSYASEQIQKYDKNKSISLEDYEKSQEILREFALLFDTAKEYSRIYTLALEKGQERQIQQQENARKMVDTLYRLQSFERKYSLKESLSKASAEITDTVSVEMEVQETREINRTLHTAEALLELKEENYGWNFPALPSQ